MAPLEEMYFQPEAESAICVQSFDDSLNSAIRTTYRISLRSSSLLMPRYPSTRVVFDLRVTCATQSKEAKRQRGGPRKRNTEATQPSRVCRSRVRPSMYAKAISHTHTHTSETRRQTVNSTQGAVKER